MRRFNAKLLDWQLRFPSPAALDLVELAQHKESLHQLIVITTNSFQNVLCPYHPQGMLIDITFHSLCSSVNHFLQLQQYWNGRGLMEIPRLLLAIAGKFPGDDYTDGRFSEPPAGLEGNLGRMPVVAVGEASIGQSAAINYYLAAENNLLGSNNLEAAQILAIGEHVKELNTAFRAIVAWGAEPTEEQLQKWFEEGATDSTGPADRAGHSTRFLTWWLGRIEAVLGSQGFAVGDKLSLADVQLFFIFGDYLRENEVAADFPQFKREPFGSKARTDAILAKFPKVKASVDSVANNANVQKWLASRGVQGF